MAKKSPSNLATNSRGMFLVRAVLLALLVVPFVIFPPVRLRSKNDATGKAEVFSARKFAAAHWNEKLLPSIKTAVNARVLYNALDSNLTDAAKKHARSVGIGGTAYYFVGGEGTVTANHDDSITLSISNDGKDTLVLDTSLVFGNAVRDGTGLLDVNAFANSEEFNAIASELNIIVENEVLPTAKKLGTVGAKLRFAGIAELAGTDSDPRPLRLTPLQVESLP